MMYTDVIPHNLLLLGNRKINQIKYTGLNILEMYHDFLKNINQSASNWINLVNIILSKEKS